MTVNEAALDTTITGSDLAAGTITGSLGTGSALETDATNQLNGSGGMAPLTYALVTGGNAATAGTYRHASRSTPNGSYIYTLTIAVRHHAGRQQRRQHARWRRASPTG